MFTIYIKNAVFIGSIKKWKIIKLVIVIAVFVLHR